uniref:RNA-directed RNA polymerase n=1 Tax=Sichuan mosquito tombus-like virus TaxID=2864009 RepID=A0A8K1HIF3_9TOMB|nr:hypothetical protein 3 [Sichuan mosquito tombus-like virus]
MEATGALEMGRFTHAVESDVYDLKDDYGTRIFGKGCNLHELAEDFINKNALFANPVYLLLDASKFDAHVSDALLRIVARFYETMLENPRERKHVRWLWSHTFTSMGRSKLGVYYKTKGTRFSGHMDTGLGNCMVMYAALKVYLRLSGVTKHVMSVNGDDSVIIVERQDLSKLLDIGVFKSLGFKMKFEYTDDFSQMEYCQCRPVHTDYGWVMARGPERVLARTGWSVKRFSKKKFKDFVLSLGMGESAVSYGVPVAYPLARLLVGAGKGGKMMPTDRKRFISYTRQKFWQSPEVATISLSTRVSYERAWGMSPDKQIEIEGKLKVSMGLTLSSRQMTAYERIVTDDPLMGTT